MERAYAPAGVRDGVIVLDRDEARHLARVRRVSAGELVEAFDGQGNSWQCRLTAADGSGAWLEVIEARDSVRASTVPELWLGTAVPKGDRFDWIVEKATELGVTRLVPLVCERSVVEPRDSKLDRLRKAVVEACKQCGRDSLMEIAELETLKSFLKRRQPEEIGLIADRGTNRLAEIIGDRTASTARMLACIGPEGGWTDGERALAAEQGWKSIGLGPHILRIETAAVAAAAVVRQYFSGLGE
jgi:16S rRNA (uracil1498-N3)-methyltransferase